MKIKPKYILLAVVIVVTIFAYLYYKFETRIQIASLNFNQEYTDKDLGIFFKYPDTGEVYRSNKDQNNQLRIFSKKTVNGGNSGFTCDLYINTGRQVPSYSATKLDGSVTYNSLTWSKTKQQDDDYLGSYLEYWHTKVADKDIILVATIDTQSYCEKIASTFKVLN